MFSPLRKARTSRRHTQRSKMNLGHIPGYYYDDEKKKYFKTQADHVAPGLKHSKSNVKREQRDAKRRRTDAKQEERRSEQTISRRVTRHPTLASTSLNREVGTRRNIVNRIDRDVTLIRLLDVETYELGGDFQILDVCARFPDDDSESMISPSSYLAVSNAVYGCRVIDSRPTDQGRAGAEVAAFHSSLVGLHPISDSSGMLPTVAIVAQAPIAPGNVFIGREPSTHPEMSSSVYMRLGAGENFLWSSSLRQDNRALVVSGTDNLYQLDLETADVSQRLSLNRESRAVTWLDERTTAFGYYDVQLWDVRARDTATRFRRRHQPITGVRAPESGARKQLLVADNRRMELYDTRMGNSPLFRLPHRHQGPQLHFDVNALGHVAAVDADNRMQVYGLTAGRHIATLTSYSLPLIRPRWNSLKHFELQACQGNGWTIWSTGLKYGMDDDD